MKIIPVSEFESSVSEGAHEVKHMVWKLVGNDEIRLEALVKTFDYSGKRTCIVCGSKGTKQAPNAIARVIVGSIFDEYGNDIDAKSTLGKEMQKDFVDKIEVFEVFCPEHLSEDHKMFWESEFLRVTDFSAIQHELFDD